MSKDTTAIPTALDKTTDGPFSKHAQDALKDYAETEINSAAQKKDGRTGTQPPEGFEFKIDKNIPVPAYGGMPLPDMEVGDSFVLWAHTRGASVNARLQISRWREETNNQDKEFTVRLDHERKYRCWRIK